MSDYIKREDAINAVADMFVFEAEGEYCGTFTRADFIEPAKDWLEDIPSADVAPVRHAMWKSYKIDVAGRGFFYCTQCHCDVYDVSNYCPNCGALMDKGGDAE